MTDLCKVEGKTFLISGAATGLGAGYVESFLKDGAKSIAILDINEEAGTAYAAKLNVEYPGKVIFVKCDCSSEESLTAAFDEVVSRFEYIDVIVNNAGIMNDAPHVWRTASNVNFNSMVSMTFKGLSHMSKDEGGRGGTIINVASTTIFLKVAFLPAYAGAKAGILHFTTSIASEIDQEVQGVRVMTICYGSTDTPLLHDVEQKVYHPKFAKVIRERSSGSTTTYQKPESAVKGLVDSFKQGTNGSVWLSTHDRPALDITPIYDRIYDIMSKEIFPGPWDSMKD